ncbi:Cyclin-C1-2 [Citrus sinensis]|nr:Cyclin-C1-2 [Citrus sinensis]
MAANFWTSSHYKQLLDQEDVDVAQPLDREKGITVEDYKLIKMQMSNYSDEKYRYEVKDILEMEMKILEALNYYLVVFHPYRSLVQGILNDTYKMDLILVHPPHLIALACIYIASVYREKDNTAWFEELRVDMNVVKNISMEILDFYENQRLLYAPGTARQLAINCSVVQMWVQSQHTTISRRKLWCNGGIVPLLYPAVEF